jgi:hypothetical protein
MKIIYFLLSIVSGSPIIKNKNIPACRNCIHYKPDLYNNEFTSSYNDCKKFGEKNIISDKIIFESADSCRRDESKCGANGKYFEEEKNINLKVLKHKIISGLPNTLLISLIIITFASIILDAKN